MFSHYSYCTGIIIGGEFAFEDNLILRPIKLGYDEAVFRRAVDGPGDFGLLCTLYPVLTFEIEARDEALENAAVVNWNSQWRMIWLSCFTGHSIYQPLQGTAPASLLGQKKVTSMALVGFHRMFNPSRLVTVSELEGARELWPNFYLLMKDDRFLHAAAVAATCFNEPRVSARMASIWSGIESLLGFNQELSFRIAVAVARLLETDPEKQQARFNAVKKLYSLRSACIHGSKGSAHSEAQGTNDSFDLLRELIVFFVKRQTLFSKSEQTTIFFKDSF